MTIAAAPVRPRPLGDSGGSGLSACLAEVRVSLAAVVDDDAASLSDDGLRAAMAEWSSGLAAYEELGARMVAAAVERDLPRRDGSASVATWLARLGRWPRRRAANLLRLARAHARLRHDRVGGSATLAAWAAGELSGDHAVLVGFALDTLSDEVQPERRDLAEAHLVAHAGSLAFDEFQVLANRVVEVVDPDGADRALGERLAEQERQALRQAVFRGRKELDGVAAFSGRIPNLHYDLLAAALEAIAAPRRDHLRTTTDPDETAAPSAPADTRPVPYGERLGRALCELIERLPADGSAPLGEGVNATVVVTVDEQRLRDGVGAASLSTGDDISVGEARRLACGASVLPMVLSGRSAVLDLGMARRLFTKYQRLALAHRDRGCDRPPAWCEAHHVRPWSQGGPTDVSNGVLLCGYHHRLVHAGEWQIAIAPDGVPEVTPPASIDPDRRPLRRTPRRPRAG